MQIDQFPPNKPNFLLILFLFGAAIIVIFFAAWLFIRTNAGHLGMRHHPAAPQRHSQMYLPTQPGPPQLG